MLRSITLLSLLFASTSLYASGYILRSDEETLKSAHVLVLATVEDIKTTQDASEKCVLRKDYPLSITKTLKGKWMDKPVNYHHVIFIFSGNCPSVQYEADPMARMMTKGSQIVAALRLSTDGKTYDVVGSWNVSEQDRLIKLMRHK